MDLFPIIISFTVGILLAIYDIIKLNAISILSDYLLELLEMTY